MSTLALVALLLISVSIGGAYSLLGLKARAHLNSEAKQSNDLLVGYFGGRSTKSSTTQMESVCAKQATYLSYPFSGSTLLGTYSFSNEQPRSKSHAPGGAATATSMLRKPALSEAPLWVRWFA
jgi:hypothetical protein